MSLLARQHSVQLPVSIQVSWFLVSCRTGELAQGVYTGNRGPAGEGGREEGRGRGEGAKQKCELFAVRQKS